MTSVRVLHVVPGYSGGIASFVENLMEEGSSDGCTMDVASFSAAPEAFSSYVHSKGGDVYRLAGGRRNLLGSFASIVRLVRRNSYDVVHCHFSGVKSLLVKLGARTARAKLVISHAHRSADVPPLAFVRLAVEQWASRSVADLLFACSDIAGSYVFGKQAYKRGNVRFMPNGVDFEACTTNPVVDVRKHFEIEDNRLLVGHIGRFTEQKNHDFILTLAKRSPEDYFFALFGDGPDFSQVKKKAEEQGLDSKVGFFGRLEGARSIIGQFDVLILPSLFEGLPTVVVEAQAAGVRSLVASSVTRQVDLGLGLVDYINLDSVDTWISSIRQSKPVADKDARLEALRQGGFTCDSMRSRYISYINEFGVGSIIC